MNRIEIKRWGRGFTLIEVLIALTLMATIALIGWRGLEWVSKRRYALDAQSASLDDVLRTLGQFENDLKQLAPATALNPAIGSRALPSALTIVSTPGSTGTVWDITLLRHDSAGSGKWRQVQWRLRPDSVWRGVSDPLVNGPVTALPLTMIMDSMTGIEMRFFVAGQGWQNTPAPQENRLIQAVSLDLQQGSKRYSRVVMLP